MAEFLIFTNDSFRFPSLPIALDGLGISHLQESILRPNGIPPHQWVQGVSGRGKLILENKSYIVEEGSGIFLPAGTPHEYYSLEGDWYVNFLCFNGFAMKETLTAFGLTEPGVYQLSDPDKILKYEDDISQIYSSHDEPKAIKASKLLYSLLVDLSLDITQNTQSQKVLTNPHLSQATTYMEANFHKPITLDDIAFASSISKEYLCSLFKKHLGLSVFDLLLSIRIAHAKTYLIQFPNQKIHEIGRMVGYEDSSYFCYVFKKTEGLTPNAFRNTRR